MNTRFVNTLAIAWWAGGMLLAVPLAGAAIPPPGAAATTHHITPAQRKRIAALSLPFIQNTGQLDNSVAYYARTFAGTAFVTRGGALVLSLPGRGQMKPADNPQQGTVLTEKPVGTAVLHPRGAGRSPTQVSVFDGNNPAHWRKDLATYASVDLGSSWPGIDYRVRAHGDNIERVFTVAPGAKASAIRMRVYGAKHLSIDDGRLIAHTGNGPVTFSRPVAFQPIGGERRPVRVAYVLDGVRYSFRLGTYDARHPVVIDPLIQATYLGGSTSRDVAYAVAIGGAGQVYVAGVSASTDFPCTDSAVATAGVTCDSGADSPPSKGGAQPANAGGPFGNDAFVAELSSDLTRISQATYFGGTGYDEATALAIGGAGQVYVAGDTTSADLPCADSGTSTAGVTCDSGTGNAPSKSGAQPANAGGASGYDAFVAVFSGDLTTISQATYLGGSGDDYGHALAIGPAGQVYLAGQTDSTDFPCTDAAVGTTGVTCDSGTGNPPSTSGAQPANTSAGGGNDAFVVALTSDLTTIKQATYLGGAIGTENGNAIAVGAAGNVYVAGETTSTDFPCTDSLVGTAGVTCDSGAGNPPSKSGAQRAPGGSIDAFVAAFGGDLKTITQATYLGGTGADYGGSLAIGAAGQVYVGGLTTAADFPCTDAAVATAGVTCDSGAGNAPSKSGAQPANAGSAGTQDAYVAKLTGDLTGIAQATYLGGTASEYDVALTLAGTGQVYVAGDTTSTDFPDTGGGAQPTNAGGNDAFVGELGANLTTIIQATYLGGSLAETNRGIAFGSSGQLYVAGYTTSADLPGTSGGAQPHLASPVNTDSSDAYVAEFDGLASPPSTGSSGGGGGAASLWMLLGVALLGLGRRCSRGRSKTG